MNTITVLLGIAVSFTVVVAAPTDFDKGAIKKLPALTHEEVHDELGQFSLRYVTAEGTIVMEKGRLVPDPDSNDTVMIVEGEVIYIGDDGKTYKTVYTADFDGYKVAGKPNIPVSSPSPIV